MCFYTFLGPETSQETLKKPKSRKNAKNAAKKTVQKSDKKNPKKCCRGKKCLKPAISFLTIFGAIIGPIFCSFFPFLGEQRKGCQSCSERALIGDDKKLCWCVVKEQDRMRMGWTALCVPATRLPVRSQAAASSRTFLTSPRRPVETRKPPKTGWSQWVFSIAMPRFSVV